MAMRSRVVRHLQSTQSGWCRTLRVARTTGTDSPEKPHGILPSWRRGVWTCPSDRHVFHGRRVENRFGRSFQLGRGESLQTARLSRRRRRWRQQPKNLLEALLPVPRPLGAPQLQPSLQPRSATRLPHPTPCQQECRRDLRHEYLLDSEVRGQPLGGGRPSSNRLFSNLPPLPAPAACDQWSHWTLLLRPSSSLTSAQPSRTCLRAPSLTSTMLS
mmetsp:Transcript_34133/g.91075  ORF Transcript_34133/g.91075 Transcript_34133/m.91075 type:complete len:215 (-) Transcript_34133:507-1151(-)